MSALDEAVQAVSLASADAAPLRSFTASSLGAVLTTRRASVPWAFSVLLLRAGWVLAAEVSATVRVATPDRLRTLTLDIEGEVDDWPDLSNLLEASLRDSTGDPAFDRWRSLMGQAVNGALATEPRWVEVHTPAGARRWSLDRGAGRAEDPYRVQRIPTEGSFRLRLAHEAEGVAAAWARWTGRHAPEAAIAAQWTEALGRPIDADALHAGVEVEHLADDTARDLPGCGRWWPAQGGGLYLRREGVRIATLGDIVQQHGGVALHGEVEAPDVGLDADGRKPRVDAGLHALIAGLHEAHSAASFSPPTSVLDGTGQPRTPAALRASDEVVYAWPHQAAAAQAQLGAVASLTPTALAWLREHTPASFVPARVLLETANVARVDLTSLQQGSVGPVSLGDGIEAYVHRHPVAAQGSIRVHAFGREVAREPEDALPGVTVVITSADDAPLDRTAQVERARARALECADLLTQAAMAFVPEDEARLRLPWMKHRWQQLGPADLGLRYEPHGVGVRLTWRDEPLLGLTVAHDRRGTPYSAADALARLRDVGGIVVGESTGRWTTLESDVPAWVPWILTARGEALLQRLVGETGVWRMPMVPEAQLRPGTLHEQSHVALSADRAETLAGQLAGHGRAADWARLALLGHGLWSLATDRDPLGVDRLPLLVAYDPSAAHPRRYVSLAAASQGHGGVVPLGAGHRDLAHPVIEACPGVAHALVEAGVVPVSAASVHRRVTRTKARAARPRARRTWLRQRVMHGLCVGALTLAEGPPGVELWSQGLRLRTVRLPAPHSAVSGRVWLQGPAVADPALRAAWAEPLVELEDAARRAVLLAAPGSERARALRAFVTAIERPASTEPLPVERAPVLGSDRLAATLRFSLGRPVTVEVSRVSWSLLREDPGLQRLRVGGLHPWVRAARAEDASAGDIGAAALGVLYALLREQRLDPGAFDRAVTRVLAALE